MLKACTDPDSIIKLRFGLDIFSRSTKAKHNSLPKSVIQSNKSLSKERRSKHISNSERMQAFFSWVCSVQEKAGYNDEQFAKFLGLSSSRSIRQYRNLEGHFPSKRTIAKILGLERLLNTSVVRHRRYANV